mgnify:CR=1 FL=1
MNFRRFTFFALVICVFSACSEKKPRSANKVDHLNIIFVLADDLDLDEVNFYDRKTTPSYTNDQLNGRTNYYHYKTDNFKMPTLDKMAAEGIIFDRFYSTSPVCTPARYPTLTGQYPHSYTYNKDSITSQIKIAFGISIHPDDDNIAKRFNTLGYTTAYIGKWHNGFNNSHMAMLDNNPPLEHSNYKELKNNYRFAVDYIQDSIGFDVADRLMSENRNMHNIDWMDEGIGNFIDSNAASPFFMYVSLPIPHGNYGDTKEINTLYTSNGELSEKPNIENDLADAQRRNWFSNSPEMGSWLDGSMANLLGKLKEHNLYENTLIVFTSDHQSRGKMTVYESARVPTFFWMPSMLEPKRIEDLASFIDLVPTFLSLAGDSSLGDFPGMDLKPLLLENQALNRDAVFIECSYFRGVASKKWKYIEHTTDTFDENFMYDNEDVFPHFRDSVQLYDLETDFAEQINLAGKTEFAEVQKEMAAKLKGFLEQ